MRVRAIIGVGIVVAIPLLGTIPAAQAHEGRTVGDGDLEVEVGFLNEPAYVGQPNAAILQLVHDGEPVMDLRDMTVTVSTGAQESEPMELEPGFFVENGDVERGIAGEYHAPFVPTQPGTYTFHYVGTVDGEEVDETFKSGPRTFDDVQDLASVTFPPVSAPTNEDLATRISQESERTGASVAAAEDAATAAADEASGARTLGVIAVVVGAVGLAAGIAGFVAARRRA